MAEEAGVYRALTTIEGADGPVTVECLSRRMSIPTYQAYQTLVKLADRGFVTRKVPSDWSRSLGPQYEITSDGRMKMKNLAEKVTAVIDELL